LTSFLVLRVILLLVSAALHLLGKNYGVYVHFSVKTRPGYDRDSPQTRVFFFYEVLAAVSLSEPASITLNSEASQICFFKPHSHVWPCQLDKLSK